MGILKYKDLKHLPGDKGSFVLGYFKKFVADTTGLWKMMQQKYGDVFAIKVLHNSSVTLVGKHTNKQILVDEAKHTENKEAWETALSELFPNSLMLMDGDEHKYHRSIMLDAFKKPAMAGYFNHMPQIISKTINEIPENETLLCFPFFKLLTLRLATKIFFGLNDSDAIEKVNTAVTDIVNASASIPLKIPGTTFYKGIKGRRYLKSYFSSLITKRKQNPGDDLFSRLCLARGEDGEQYTDAEIVDHLIFVLMASHDTTAITLTFASYFLAKHTEWQERLRKEIKNLASSISEPNSLRQLKDISLVIKETLRLHPPLTQVLRKLTKDFTVEGIEIPKDTVVACIMQMTHIDERIWTKPQDFDPERFNTIRKEDKTCPFSYAPFGAGPHHCIGYAFADMQIKLVLMELLGKFELVIDPTYEPPIREVPLKQPMDNMPIFMKSIQTKT